MFLGRSHKTGLLYLIEVWKVESIHFQWFNPDLNLMKYFKCQQPIVSSRLCRLFTWVKLFTYLRCQHFTLSLNLQWFILIIPLLPGGGGGYTVCIPPLPGGEEGILFYLCPSVCPSVRPRYFFSNYRWQKSDIWSQALYRYAILWVVFFDPSDSYFLFADLVGFIHIHRCQPLFGAISNKKLRCQ